VPERFQETPALLNGVFHKKVAARIPEELQPALEPLLDTIASLSACIGQCDPELEWFAQRALSGDGPLATGARSGGADGFGFRAHPGGAEAF
jgi:hypothetical protein